MKSFGKKVKADKYNHTNSMSNNNNNNKIKKIERIEINKIPYFIHSTCDDRGEGLVYVLTHANERMHTHR